MTSCKGRGVFISSLRCFLYLMASYGFTGFFLHDTYSNDALYSLWYSTPSIREIQFICSVMLLQRREPRAMNGHSGIKNLVIKRTFLALKTGLPWWLSGKKSTCQCRRQRFHPWSGRIPHGVEQLSLYAPQLSSLRSGAREPAPLKPRTLEPVLRNKSSLCGEKPALPLEGGPCSPSLEESPRGKEDPAQPKGNK